MASKSDLGSKVLNRVSRLVYTRRVPIQRAVDRDEIPYPYKVHDTTLHSRA